MSYGGPSGELPARGHDVDRILACCTGKSAGKAAKQIRSDTLAGISLAGESSDQVMEENQAALPGLN
jgi:hypothetical protein